MTDIHTHILPGVDDGARDAVISLAMLRQEAKQGVDTVVFTPHFYRDRTSVKGFLARRQNAAKMLERTLDGLMQEERAEIPDLVLGAEVAWMPNLNEWPGLEYLCLGNSRYFLLELPDWQWNDQLIAQLYDIQGRTGLIPIIAHLERYLKKQHAEHIDAVLSLGVPVQLSAGAFLRILERGKVLRLIQDHKAHLVASDAHDLTHRPPNLGAAMAVIRRKLGNETADSLAAASDKLLECERRACGETASELCSKRWS